MHGVGHKSPINTVERPLLHLAGSWATLAPLEAVGPKPEYRFFVHCEADRAKAALQRNDKTARPGRRGVLHDFRIRRWQISKFDSPLFSRHIHQRRTEDFRSIPITLPRGPQQRGDCDAPFYG